jgi:LruC domain-containing protein
MKKIALAILLGTMGVLGHSQNLTNDFEQGTRPYYQGLCWQFGGVSLSNVTPITGVWSARTGSLSNPSPNSFWMYSPWVNFSGSGNILFKHKLQSFTGPWKRIRVLLGNPNDTTTIFLAQYDYVNPTDVNRVISASVPVNITGVYRVIWNFYGSGGNDRIMIDDITIPAPYWSDPSNNCLPLQLVTQDADGDGVSDTQDEYPTDPYRAYNNYYPATGSSTLAFEDLWPGKGDYDMNDVVVGYKFQVVSNAQHNVVDLKGTFVLKASGAGMHNGFGFQLPGVNPASIIGTTGASLLPGSGFTIGPNGTEGGQTSATVIVFDDALRVLGAGGSPSGTGFNTSHDNAQVPPVTLNINMTFMNNGTPGPGGAVTLTALNIASFNPFIIANSERGREIHLPGYLPTSLVDTTYFGNADDDTNPLAGKYYKSKTNLPWALNIYGVFDYPIERVSILNAYLKFADWVESSGTLYPDWYYDSPGYRNSALIY